MSLKIGYYNYNDKGFQRDVIQTISTIFINWKTLTVTVTGQESANYAEYERGTPGNVVASELTIDLTDPETLDIIERLSDKIWEQHRTQKVIKDWELNETQTQRSPVDKSIDDLGGQVIDIETLANLLNP